jgi:ribose transport system permease protein
MAGAQVCRPADAIDRRPSPPAIVDIQSLGLGVATVTIDASIAAPPSSERDNQRLTDLKYRWPARYRASWAALLVVVLGAVIFARSALSGPSITLVTALAGVLAIAALGQVLIVMTGAIDLSISAIVSVGAGIVVHYADDANVWVLALGSLCVCALLSLFNGILIVVLRLNALIVTLATVGILIGLIQLWTGVALSATGRTPQTLVDFAQSEVLNINTVFIAAMIIAGVLATFLNKTRPGKSVAYAGSNPRAAHMLGIRVKAVGLMAFALAGLLYGAAGVLLAGYVGSPDILSGADYQLLAITVAGVAGVLFTGGPGSISSVISACLFLVLLDQVLSVQGMSSGTRVVVQGLVLAIAVAAITIGQKGASSLGRFRIRRSS